MAVDSEYWRTKRKPDGSIEWASFPPFDDKEAEKKLDPVNRAQTFALSNISSIDDESELTSDEQEIINVVNDHIAELDSFFQKNVGAVKDEIERDSIESDPDEHFRKIKINFKKNVNNIFEEKSIKLRGIYAERLQARRYLANFRRVNTPCLHRDAEYPESTIYHLAIAFVAIFFESVANSYFFAQASDTGLLGGWITAFMVSFANVLISMFSGFLFLQNFNHVDKLRKYGGALFFVISLFLLGFLHLSIAHYREVLTRNPDAEIISFEVLHIVWNNPFNLKDLESLLLIGIGIVISAIGIWKGYTFDDPYPRYGKLYRKWKKLDDQIFDIEKQLRMSINSLYNQYVEKTHTIIERLNETKKKLESKRGEVESIFDCCESYYNQAHNGALRLLNIYRNTIQKICEDNNCFPFFEGLLDKKNGIYQINIHEKKDQTYNMLYGKISLVDRYIHDFPKKQDDFIEDLNALRVEKSSEEAIKELIENTAKRVKDDNKRTRREEKSEDNADDDSL